MLIAVREFSDLDQDEPLNEAQHTSVYFYVYKEQNTFNVIINVIAITSFNPIARVFHLCN
jgi:hypothetical protein